MIQYIELMNSIRLDPQTCGLSAHGRPNGSAADRAPGSGFRRSGQRVDIGQNAICQSEVTGQRLLRGDGLRFAPVGVNSDGRFKIGADEIV